MIEVTLVKQLPLALTDAESAVMRRVLFESVNGLSKGDQRGWRRFWNMVVKAEPGEMFSIDTWFPRVGKFHRLHMLMEQRVFQAQERISEFESFRAWLKVGAGFVDWIPGPKGAVMPIPRSIAYRKLDEEGMREFHEACVTFLQTPHAAKVLWPHLVPQTQADMMHAALGEFL